MRGHTNSTILYRMLGFFCGVVNRYLFIMAIHQRNDSSHTFLAESMTLLVLTCRRMSWRTVYRGLGGTKQLYYGALIPAWMCTHKNPSLESLQDSLIPQHLPTASVTHRKDTWILYVPEIPEVFASILSPEKNISVQRKSIYNMRSFRSYLSPAHHGLRVCFQELKLQ